jgi:hypothetical protein
MALNIPSMDDTVQVVMTVHTLEVILSRFPRLEVFPVVHDPDDLPTYAFRMKAAAPPPAGVHRPAIPRPPRRKPSSGVL